VAAVHIRRRHTPEWRVRRTVAPKLEPQFRQFRRFRRFRRVRRRRGVLPFGFRQGRVPPRFRRFRWFRRRLGFRQRRVWRAVAPKLEFRLSVGLGEDGEARRDAVATTQNTGGESGYQILRMKKKKKDEG